MKQAIKIIRWTTRFSGVSLFLFFVWFVIEYGSPRLSAMTEQEFLLFVANMAMLFGLIVVWKFELIGSMVLIVAYVCFSFVNHSFWVEPVYPTFLFIGLVHFLCWVSDAVIIFRKNGLSCKLLFM